MGQDLYLLSPPLFDEITMALPQSGTRLEIAVPTSPPTSERHSDRPRYINSVHLRGREIGRQWLTHSEILEGGRLEITLVDSPSLYGADLPPPVPDMEEPCD